MNLPAYNTRMNPAASLIALRPTWDWQSIFDKSCRIINLTFVIFFTPKAENQSQPKINTLTRSLSQYAFVF